MRLRRKGRMSVSGGSVASEYQFANAGIRFVAELMFKNVHPPTRLVMACFDESGKLHDSDIVAFGGCVGSPDYIDQFSTQWAERLRRDGLAYTSMKDAMHFHGPYSRWDGNETKRDAVLRDLTAMIADSELLMISSPMTSAQFKALPPEQRRRLWNDPQYCGFEACIAGILKDSQDTALHVVCDLSEQYSEKCITLFNKLRSRNRVVKERCFGISFADDEHHAGLQAADLIAYCARADHQRAARPPEPIVDALISTLTSHGGEGGWFVYRADGAGIGHG